VALALAGGLVELPGHIRKEHDCQQDEDENEEFPVFDRCHGFLVVFCSCVLLWTNDERVFEVGDTTGEILKKVTG
jgi:hypothetical protein